MKGFLAVFLCVCLLCVPVRGQPNEKLVALTFDDGPSGRFTRRLLEGLDTLDVQATFFLCGYRIAQYPELTEKIFQEGHEIGFHGYSHKSMKTMGAQEIMEELQKTQALLPEGCEQKFLRCPGGICSECTCDIAGKMGLSLAYWSVDPQDWNSRDSFAIANDVIRQVKDGDIILMHDMSDSSVDAALEIIRQLTVKGYRFVTLSQLAEMKGISLVPGTVYSYFR